MKKLKVISAWVCAVAFCASIVPVAAYAADGTNVSATKPDAAATPTNEKAAEDVTNTNTGTGTATGSTTTTSATESTSLAMYRLYNPNSGEHFYTSDTTERDNVIKAGWSFEGIGWYAPAKGDAVYRLYNPNAGEHHYTLSKDEKDMLVKAGWKDEGIGWYSASKDTGVAIYRQYNPNAFANNHNFSASIGERDYLVGLGWKDEGIAWYGVQRIQVKVTIDDGDAKTTNVEKTVEVDQGVSALAALKATGAKVETTEKFGSKAWITSINGVKETAKSGWVYTVNGTSPNVTADVQEVKANDQVVFSVLTW